jgi:hypothetical protein
MEEKEDWPEHKTIITLLLEAFGLNTTHTVEDVLWAMGKVHWSNVELDLQSLFGLHMLSCTYWLRPRNSPTPPAFGLTYEGAFGQPR